MILLVNSYSNEYRNDSLRVLYWSIRINRRNHERHKYIAGRTQSAATTYIFNFYLPANPMIAWSSRGCMSLIATNSKLETTKTEGQKLFFSVVFSSDFSFFQSACCYWKRRMLGSFLRWLDVPHIVVSSLPMLLGGKLHQSPFAPHVHINTLNFVYGLIFFKYMEIKISKSWEISTKFNTKTLYTFFFYTFFFSPR